MNASQSLASARTVLGYLALALALCALAKFLGVQIPSVPGDVSTLALLAIALKTV